MRYAGAVSIDLRRLDRVLEVDRTSRAARIQAGATGPGARGPAARARPHAAPLPAVVRVLDARRLDRDPRRRALRHALHAHRRPGRVGARGHARPATDREPAAAGLGRRAEPGPAADRLGGHPRRDHRGLGARAGPPGLQGVGRRRASTTSPAGAEAVRALSQSGLYPSNCRLLDPSEAAITGRPTTEGGALLVLGFESADHPVDALDGARARAAPDHGGDGAERGRRGDGRPAGRRTRSAPGATRSCARRTCATLLVAAGMISETFETAITWDRFAEFHAAVTEAARARGARDLRRRHGDLPLHARLSGRPGALLHDPRAGAPRLGARAVGRDQGGRRRRR